MFKTLNNCRLCSGTFYLKSIKLKDTPPANELYASKELARNAEKFPLEVVMCSNCKHVQLKHIVNPNRLFDNYVYKSGTSNFFVEHFEKLADYISESHPIQSYVLEVGSNDGILLSSLEKRNIKSIGVEPSEFLAKECVAKNQVVYNSYFDEGTVNKIITEHGKASIVLGNNVFAHIEDLRKAFNNVFNILNSNGLFIFEVAHFRYILEDGIFDTIYHEHMSYHTAVAMEKFANDTGFKLFNIEKISSHGGSLRFFLSKDKEKKVNPSVREITDEEKSLGLENENVMGVIESKIQSIKVSVKDLVYDLSTSRKKKFIGYGAPAKVVTFLAEMELENLEIIGIVDDNLNKQGKYLPGSGYKIVSSEQMVDTISKDKVIQDDGAVCFVFPWNLKSEIIEKLRSWLPINSNAVVFFPEVEKVDI
jgi:SAM-dependent methyltransferase